MITENKITFDTKDRTIIYRNIQLEVYKKIFDKCKELRIEQKKKMKEEEKE